MYKNIFISSKHIFAETLHMLKLSVYPPNNSQKCLFPILFRLSPTLSILTTKLNANLYQYQFHFTFHINISFICCFHPLSSEGINYYFFSSDSGGALYMQFLLTYYGRYLLWLSLSLSHLLWCPWDNPG